MPSFYSLLLTSGCKIATLSLSKCKHYGCRSKKRPDLISITAVVFSLLSAVFASLEPSSAALTISNPTVATSLLGVIDLAAASVFGENLVKNCVKFCDLG